jgi:nucleoside-diphosphate kinase
MTGRTTLMMIKPDAVSKGYVGEILAKVNGAGFKIIAMKYLKLTLKQAEEFYKVHSDKGFYTKLTQFMSSGPIVAAIIEKDNAVIDYRKLIGATDPAKAEEGTVRKLYGASIENNAVHGSDSDENALIESDFFFSRLERF